MLLDGEQSCPFNIKEAILSPLFYSLHVCQWTPSNSRSIGARSENWQCVLLVLQCMLTTLPSLRSLLKKCKVRLTLFPMQYMLLNGDTGSTLLCQTFSCNSKWQSPQVMSITQMGQLHGQQTTALTLSVYPTQCCFNYMYIHSCYPGCRQSDQSNILRQWLAVCDTVDLEWTAD